MQRRSNPARLDAIDMLRSLAIFFVLLNHVNMRLQIAHIPYTAGLSDQLVSSLVWNGQMGVQIFFAVSGFLITSTTIRRWGSLANIDIRHFYRLRFARIAPLLLLLIAALSILHLLHVQHFVVSPKVGGLPQALFAALTFHINALEATRGYLPANWDILWSLSVEEVFYLAFPLICSILSKRNGLVALLLIFVSLGPLARTAFSAGNEVWREYSYLGGMDAIALGCLTAIAASRHSCSQRTLNAITAIALATMTYILCFSLNAPRWGLAMTLLALGTCLLMFAASQTNWQLAKPLQPILSLGRNSYEIYLTHMFIVFAFFDLFIASGKPMRLVPALFAGTLLVSAIFGIVVSRFYSEPFNRYLRRAA